MKIYVASSWRNEKQPTVVRALLNAGYHVYDFRNPSEGDNGFHWSEIDAEWQSWDTDKFVESLKHPVAVKGFLKDFDAMNNADVCVLVMPCGRSAHLEAGYFVGAMKRLIILTDSGEPELMYKMADSICKNMDEVLNMLNIFKESDAGEALRQQATRKAQNCSTCGTAKVENKCPEEFCPSHNS